MDIACEERNGAWAVPPGRYDYAVTGTVRPGLPPRRAKLIVEPAQGTTQRQIRAGDGTFRMTVETTLERLENRFRLVALANCVSMPLRRLALEFRPEYPLPVHPSPTVKDATAGPFDIVSCDGTASARVSVRVEALDDVIELGDGSHEEAWRIRQEVKIERRERRPPFVGDILTTMWLRPATALTLKEHTITSGKAGGLFPIHGDLWYLLQRGTPAAPVSVS
jgi:hypothetical protein